MAAEWIGMQFHGNTITHIDALCHNSVDARMTMASLQSLFRRCREPPSWV